MTKPSSLVLSVDFEDWYQGLTSTAYKRHLWKEFHPCLETGSLWLLDQLASRDIRATFFVVGRVAEEYPDLVRHIVERGHEIGLHGFAHEKVSVMTPMEFEKDVERNLEALDKIVATRPIGYRAPWFSISEKTTWFWTILAKCGLKYDSSVFPIKNPLYGLPTANPMPHVLETEHGRIWEFPITTMGFLTMNLPFSGGFYFRMLPLCMIRRMTERMLTRGKPVICYFHPWEFVPDHQRPNCVTAREQLSHYGGLGNNRSKFLAFIESYRFITFRSLYENESTDES